MKNTIKLVVVLALISFSRQGFSQTSFYSTSGGEMIFQWSDVTQGGPVKSNMRWTVFLHLGSYFHMDFNNNFGLYTGLSLRNVGYITDIGTEKKIRRTYNLGVPLAFKAGLFDKHLYLFAGGEYEWQFHYKEKYWPNGNGKRDGEKVKYTEWFSDRVNRFIPSFFVGLELPSGFNVKFKYYLENYMNQDYVDANGDFPYRDVDVQMFYISLSWNMRTDQFIKIVDKD